MDDANEYFNPQTGESYKFGPDQQPPQGWKKLKPIPSPTPGLPPGSTVTWIPGREPKLYVNPETGDVEWVQFPFLGPEGWKPLAPLVSPPPMTRNDDEYFNPATGESYKFGPHQQPPGGWKKLKPIPSPTPGLPPGSTVSWIRGMEPKLYVDPATGESRWIQFGEKPPQGWKPLTPQFTPPPMTHTDNEYFNPQTGESYRFDPDQQTPTGWKKLKPIPSPTPGLPPGSTVTWIPGREPKLYVNPETGDVQWVQFGELPPQGWKPLDPRVSPPPMTTNNNEYFNPQTGESYNFGPDQQPPPGWKILKPIPSPTPGLPPGTTVTWIPGREPRLYVNPATGESQWVQFGENPPQGSLPLAPRFSPPPLTNNPRDYFNPATGESVTLGPDQQPPQGWKVLKPIPSPTPGLPPGSTVTWIPGKEPKLYVNPTTGDVQWVQFGENPPNGWKPLVQKMLGGDAGDGQLRNDSVTPKSLGMDSSGVSRDSSTLSGFVDALSSDVAKALGAVSAAAGPVTEWSIWNPGYGISRSLQGTLWKRQGAIFEWLAGGNLAKNFWAADFIEGGVVGQIKATKSVNLKTISGVIRKAANKLVDLIESSPTFLGGSRAEIRVIVPTGTKEEVVEQIYTTARRTFGRQSQVSAEVNVVKGIPGKLGVALKGLSVLGGVVNTYQLVQDIRKGDVASGIGSGAGVTTFVLETGATVLSSTALATGSALTGSFAAGYAVGTVINDHVLSQETKSLVGETLVEFVDHGWSDIKEFYFGIKPNNK